MEKSNLILAKLLFDFEETKYVLANNNSKLIENFSVRSKYYLKKSVDFKEASYNQILANSIIHEDVDGDNYFSYREKNDKDIIASRMEVGNGADEFLLDLGYRQIFEIEKIIYTYTNNDFIIYIVNVIDVGLYIGVDKAYLHGDSMEDVCRTFDLPIGEIITEEDIERKIISNVRRHM